MGAVACTKACVNCCDGINAKGCTVLWMMGSLDVGLVTSHHSLASIHGHCLMIQDCHCISSGVDCSCSGTANASFVQCCWQLPCLEL